MLKTSCSKQDFIKIIKFMVIKEGHVGDILFSAAQNICERHLRRLI